MKFNDGRDKAARRLQTLIVGSSLIGAAAASSCCVLPLVLFGLGVSGAWIGTFTRLAPYQPYFVAATLCCLAYGYWLIYRSAKSPCSVGGACARPLPDRLVKAGLIVATILAVAALGVDFIASLLPDS